MPFAPPPRGRRPSLPVAPDPFEIMRLDTPYENPKLEAKRLAGLKTLEADAVLRGDRHRRRDDTRQAVGRLLNGLDKTARPAGGRLCDAIGGSKLLDAPPLRNGLHCLIRWRASWLRDPADWTPTSHNAGRQFAALLRHLLALYDVPTWFDVAFLARGAPARDGEGGLEQRWFVHVGGGGNLRKAPGLPVVLSKKQAHRAMLAPANVADSIVSAVRYGQVVDAGGSVALARAVCGSRIGQAFGSAGVEAFWSELAGWLVREAAREPMFAAGEVGPLVDFLHAQKFERDAPQPRLSLKGRTLVSTLRQMREWHADLTRVRRAEARDAARLGFGADLSATWRPSGVRGFDRVEGEGSNKRRVLIVELLGGGELLEEGRRMRHCVASYARQCAAGGTAIFSLRLGTAGDFKPLVTLEVSTASRQVVQARGPCNRAPSPQEARWLRAWATAAGLAFSPYVLRSLHG